MEQKIYPTISLSTKWENGNGGFQIAPRQLFWHYPHYGNQGGEPSSIIRQSDWKLIHYWEDGPRWVNQLTGGQLAALAPLINHMNQPKHTISAVWNNPTVIAQNNFKYKSLSSWSCNTTVGCGHGCTFCYVPSTEVESKKWTGRFS